MGEGEGTPAVPMSKTTLSQILSFLQCRATFMSYTSHILKPNLKKKKFNPHELGMKSFIKIAPGQKALLKKDRKKEKKQTAMG